MASSEHATESVWITNYDKEIIQSNNNIKQLGLSNNNKENQLRVVPREQKDTKLDDLERSGWSNS